MRQITSLAVAFATALSMSAAPAADACAVNLGPYLAG